MNCKKMEKLILTDYIDGNLKGRSFEEVELHIRSCPTCHALAEDLRSTGKLFKAVGHEAAPAEVWHKIRTKITAEPAGRYFPEDIFERLRFYLPHLRPAVVIASAAVLLFFVLATIKFMPHRNYLETRVAQDDILSISYNSNEEDTAEYDLGTPAEMFFL
ncbi:MAG: zf-HC2 domain-containing protein [Candidatus Omnitrophota bacterium]|nr:zf-HC2 domain-containing protein [Candidatus Omnitrophota bacterium]